MDKIKVYYFEKYDITSDETKRSLRPATQEAILRSGGKAIEQTAQEVDSALLDENGFLKIDHA